MKSKNERNKRKESNVLAIKRKSIESTHSETLSTIHILLGQVDVAVTVTAVRGSVVTLAISAPPDVDIWRGELYEKIQQEIADRKANDGQTNDGHR